MNLISFITGVLAAGFLGAIGAGLLNASIGPSVNTVEMCKRIQVEGYLQDECFDKFGDYYQLKERGCKGYLR